ncbi:MAG: protoglobin domain-containing protein [Dermatophilus congolensis]|nr:protoglobin domain-containing protein [Dermatophilus congolensis]
MHEISRTALESMPPQARFGPQDRSVLLRYTDYLLSLEDEFVTGFYDTLFEHPPTRAVFSDDERPMREESLREWWQRTVRGPIDDDYFAWMAMVGLVHVVRGVANPMMLAMCEHAAHFADTAVARAGLPPEEADAVVDAFRRFTTSVGAVITYGYDQAVSDALFNIAGMRKGLLHRLRDQEVTEALTQARGALAL